jgi:hypothetical protein
MLDLKIKRLSTGEIEKLKARLLLDGSKEWPSDEELFSPTASKETILFLIALGVLLGLQIHEMDITGAFLYSVLTEPVYCRLPTQFRDENDDFIYWKLKKSLYGMRRAPRNFFDHMVGVLIKGKYQQSVFDRCCFHLQQGSDLFIVAFWEDNMYYFATNNHLTVDFEIFMAENFKITKNDEAAHILGMHSQSNFDGSKTMLMPAILDKLVFECFGTTTFNSALTPMPSTFSHEANDDSPRLSTLEVTRQRKLLGLLLQVVPIRPDMGFPHSVLATRITRATQADYHSIQRIVQYFAFTADLGITFHRSNNPQAERQALIIDCYADYSHNCHTDSKGHFGIGATMGNNGSGFFNSKSGKLQVVTDSTAAGEILCGVKMCKYFDWYRDFCESLGITLAKTTRLHSDNAAMRSTCTVLNASTKRLKHVLLHINFIYERVKAGLLECVECPTAEMTVDGLTKPLPSAAHWHHLPNLLGHSEAMSAKCAQVHRIQNKLELMPKLRWRRADEYLASQASSQESISPPPPL